MEAEESLAIRNTLTPMPEFSAVSLAAPGKKPVWQNIKIRKTNLKNPIS
jgi:hypothetical protein